MDSLTQIKNKFKGIDAYVLGSGPSMQYIDKSFFEGKCTIVPNQVWEKFPATIVVVKHAGHIEQAVNAGHLVVVSKHDCGDIDKPLNKTDGARYVFTHKRGRFGDGEKNFQENLDAIGKDDDLFVSHSTITSCIHLAAYIGAKNIIICGHDCGYLNDKGHCYDYGNRLKAFHNKRTGREYEDYHNWWFEKVNSESERLKKKLVEVYGCNIVSLNPFLNFRMEGHRYATKK